MMLQRSPSPSTHSLLNERGYTLYLVMVILAVGGILFSITLRDIRAIHLFTKKEVQRRQAKLLAESGIVRIEQFFNGGDDHSVMWETPGFKEMVESYGMISIVVERFGFFSLITSSGKRNTTRYTLHGLLGRTIPESLMPTLTLTGQVSGLILHKGSNIDGTIVFHHGEIYAKKNGNPLPEYTRRLSLRESPPLPFDSLIVPEIFERYRQKVLLLRGKGHTIEGTITIDNKNDSLLKWKPLNIKGDCIIRTPRTNDAVITVTGTCVVEDSAVLNKTTCYANSVVINACTTNASLLFSLKSISLKAGFHNSQFLAGDSITIRSGASFGQMTVFANCHQYFINDSLHTLSGGIFIDERATVTGSIISCVAQKATSNTIVQSIVIGRRSKVNGVIITDGDCFLQECEIKGHVWARSIIARDNDTYYTNYLIASSITPDSYRHPFPLIGAAPLKSVFIPVSQPAQSTACD